MNKVERAIVRIGRALARDIGGQRHRARALEQQLDRLIPGKGEDEAAVRQPFFGDRFDPRSEIDTFADA